MDRVAALEGRRAACPRCGTERLLYSWGLCLTCTLDDVREHEPVVYYEHAVAHFREQGDTEREALAAQRLREARRDG